jgi:hypothetical protein
MLVHSATFEKKTPLNSKPQDSSNKTIVDTQHSDLSYTWIIQTKKNKEISEWIDMIGQMDLTGI